jgi:eukaryotic-like serine/threonine-protein kinase
MIGSMDRLASALADRYRVERELGQGGMATVYLAHDLRHDRQVAIKVLHPDLAAALGADRFLTEIKTTARLQHPHILPLLDSGAADGLLFYVMPYVSGETLRSRLERERQLPIDDAVRIAREVADALGAAHAIGVIHRDIKPENILLQGGHALVADFGIALAVQSAGTARMTQTGLSLGTPQYMSPEQAMGEKAIDLRCDIYALGAVTYEMLVGEPPFTGATVQAIVAKSMTERPVPPSAVRDTVPQGMEQAILRALAKLPADRFGSVKDYSDALLGQGTGERIAAATGASRRDAARMTGARALRNARRLNITLGSATLIAVGAAAWASSHPAIEPTGVVGRFELTTTSEGLQPYFDQTAGKVIALSRDGTRAVFAVATQKSYALAVRHLDQMTAQVLPGTEDAANPEFSPDGLWIAFEVPGGVLRKIAVDGTSLMTVSETGVNGSGGLDWLSNREIVFSVRLSGGGLMIVPAGGGPPRPFFPVDTVTGEGFALGPRAVADGRIVLYTTTRTNSFAASVALIRVSDGERRVLPELRAARVLGLIDGLIVYVRPDGSLMAAPFDERSLTAGAPIQMASGVATQNWHSQAAISADGALMFQDGGTSGQLVEVGFDGSERLLAAELRGYVHPRYSPNGRHLAFDVTGANGVDVYVLDSESRAVQRITSDGGGERPEWSPDGGHVLFTSARNSGRSMWSQPLDGSGPAFALHTATHSVREGLITPDGTALVYRIDHPTTNRDIWLRPLTGDTTPVPILATASDEKQPRISPDSRWMVYMSDESGQEEVYVRRLNAAGGRIRVSVGGGREPIWSRDGRHLYYREGTRMMEATVSTSPALAITGRRKLFEGPYMTEAYHQNYDLSPDGRSFVMIKPVTGAVRLMIVVNWAQELRMRQ